MSVDPDQPSASEPAPSKAQAVSSGENADSLPQKRRFKRGGAESEEDERSDQTIQLLSTLLQDLIARKEQPTATEIDAKTAKYHRLSKTGSGATGAPTEAISVPENVPPTVVSAKTATPEAPSVTPSAPPPVTFRPAPLYAPRFKARWLSACLLGFLVLIGAGALTVMYFRAPAGDPGARSNRPLPPVPAALWTDAALTQLDQALAADQAGDLKGALRLASAIKKPDVPSPPGLDLYLASITTRQEHTFDVEADLLRAVSGASVEDSAAINERLAFNFSRARDFEKAAEFFQTGSRADPFSPALYYHWGDTLRHLGHFRDADTAFRRALNRLPTGRPEVESLRECIDFKARLSLVEQGRDAELQTEMAEQLKAPVPSGYWWLTAAAVALQHKNLEDAAGFLEKARETLGATQFDSLLNDYFFRAFADRKELAAFFPADPAARRAKLIPTMTYSVEP